MPESKKRKKAAYTTPLLPSASRRRKPSPVWLAPVMLAMFAIGIVWLVTFYIAGADLPLVGGLGNANLLIGFAFIIVGFALSTQWR